MQGAFKRALSRADEIKILLNHRPNRVLGSTKDNLVLKEDIIGLRVVAEITDPEVVKKAKEKRLRGWSFGFTNPTEQKNVQDGMELREITDMDMFEVSLIDEAMRPWYESTTVETRAGENGEFSVEFRSEEFEADYIGFKEQSVKKKVDNRELKDIIERLGGKV